MQKKLLALSIVVFALPMTAYARSMKTCESFDDPVKTGLLQKELEAKGIKYEIESDPYPNSICVSSEDRSQFIASKLKLFPAQKAPPPSVRVPPSPSGIPLTSTKLLAAEHRQALEAELTKKGIWFTKDETEAVWYEWTRESEVQNIIFRIAESVPAPSKAHVSTKRNVGFQKKPHANLFENVLNEHGIKSTSKYKNGMYWVAWDAKDTEQMNSLLTEAQRRIAKSEATEPDKSK